MIIGYTLIFVTISLVLLAFAIIVGLKIQDKIRGGLSRRQACKDSFKEFFRS